MKETDREKYHLHLVVAGIITLMVLYLALYMIQTNSFRDIEKYKSATMMTYPLVFAIAVIIASYSILYKRRIGWLLTLILVLATIYRDVIALTSLNYEMKSHHFTGAWYTCDVLQYIVLALALILLFTPVVYRNCIVKPKTVPVNRRLSIAAFAVMLGGVILCEIGQFQPFLYIEYEGTVVTTATIWEFKNLMFYGVNVISIFTAIILSAIVSLPVAGILSVFRRLRTAFSILTTIFASAILLSLYTWFDTLMSFMTIGAFERETGAILMIVGGIIAIIGSLLVLYTTRFIRPSKEPDEASAEQELKA